MDINPRGNFDSFSTFETCFLISENQCISGIFNIFQSDILRESSKVNSSNINIDGNIYFLSVYTEPSAAL